MSDNHCPFCGADKTDKRFSWHYINFACGTYADEPGKFFQERQCLQRQRDQLQIQFGAFKKQYRETWDIQQAQINQLQARLEEAERLLHKWVYDTDHRDTVLPMAKVTIKFLGDQEPLGKEFEQVLHDNMAELMVKT
jgi:hypothetical protein